MRAALCLPLLVLSLGACGRIDFERAVLQDGSLTFLDGGRRHDGSLGIDAPMADASTDATTPAGGAIVEADTWLNAFDTATHGDEPMLLCGRSMGGPLNYPIVRFDLSAVTAPIARATLRLYQNGNRGSATFTVTVHRILEAWDESAADWTNATATNTWSGPGGAFDPTPSASTAVPLGSFGWYEWDLTDLVRSWLAGTVPNHGVQLVFGSVSTGTWIEWASAESATSASVPELMIE